MGIKVWREGCKGEMMRNEGRKIRGYIKILEMYVIKGV